MHLLRVKACPNAPARKILRFNHGGAGVARDTRYIGAISADAERHRGADLCELSQIEPDTGPEPAQSSWIDAR